jgi:hypothetical protein
LWDVEILVNKALVYSGLTAALGVLAVMSTALIDYGMKLWLGDSESSVWAVVISALPVAAVFRPLQDLMQKWVDRSFKPEEVNFADTFIEFTPAVRELLTTERIIKTVSNQVQKQLNVDFAKVYLAQENGLMVDCHSIGEISPLTLKEKQLEQLQAGELLINDGGAPYSLIVPLVVPRACIPDFLGAVVLGHRLNGKGYSTQILDSLKSLGADAGKAIYLSQISEQARRKVALEI